MKITAVAGSTGLLCGQLILYLVQNNIRDIDNLRILCIGRGIEASSSDDLNKPMSDIVYGVFGDDSFADRTRKFIQDYIWRHLIKDCDEQIMNKIHAAIIPIEFDALSSSFTMDAWDYQILTTLQIEDFYYVEALNGCQETPSLKKELEKFNATGRQNIQKLLETLPYSVANFKDICSEDACKNIFDDLNTSMPVPVAASGETMAITQV